MNIATPQALISIIDDDASVRAAVADLLASVDLASRCYGSVAEFLAALAADTAKNSAETPARPGCLVLDVRMPGASGLALQRQLPQHGIAQPVIFITGHGDIPMSVAAMKAGAIEFLTKPFRDQDLLDAIARGIELDQTRLQRAAAHAAVQARWNLLSAGERAVAQGVIAGLLNKQIAHQLGVSEITVKVRRAAVMRTLQVRTLADLVRLGERLGEPLTNREH